MATYKIELLLSGKNQLANVMNNAAGSVKGVLTKLKHLPLVRTKA